MLLSIGNIPEGHSVLSQKVEVEEDRADWIPLIGKLDCRAEIDRLQTRISGHVFFQGKVEMECSRCLKKIEHPITGDCYVLLKNDSADKNRPAPEEEECDFHFNDTTDEIDIRSAIFDEIILSLPLKPLCVDTCPGIALTSSGSSQSQEKKTSDPRWDGLKKIILKKPSKGSGTGK
jgi:uncharacterized metal-binding protein YceD (DUF177 family)